MSAMPLPQGYPLGLLGTLQNDWGLLGPMGTTMPTPQAPKGLGDPRTMGLLSAAAGMLQAAGPSPRPISFGQGIGMGAMQGIGSYQDALKSQREQEYYKSLIAAQQAKAAKDKREAEKDEAARRARGLLAPHIGLDAAIAPDLDDATYRAWLSQNAQDKRYDRVGANTAYTQEGADRRHATPSGSTIYGQQQANVRHGTPSGSTIFAQEGADRRTRPIVTSDDLGRPVSRTDFVPGQGYGPTQTMQTTVPNLPPGLVVPTENIENISSKLNPWSGLAEAWSKTGGAVLGAGSNEERDALRTRFRDVKRTLYAIQRTPGGRSNQHLALAIGNIPETFWENPDRAKNMLGTSFESLQQAYDSALKDYEAAPDKKTRQEAYQLARDIRNVFEMMQMPVGPQAQQGPIQRANPQDEALMNELLGQ